MMDSPPPASAQATLPDCVRILGFPGPFLDWGVALVRTQIAARERATETVWLPLPEGLEIGPEQPLRLLVSGGPDYAVADTGMPTLVFLGSMR